MGCGHSREYGGTMDNHVWLSGAQRIIASGPKAIIGENSHKAESG